MPESESNTDEIRKHNRIGNKNQKTTKTKSENRKEQKQKLGATAPLFGHESRGEGRPRSLHPSVLATYRMVKEGHVPFTLRLGHKPKGDGRLRSFHPLVLATNREVKEGRAPFTLLF